MFDSPLSASAYEVLAVAPDVDDETLRKAYRLRLRQSHPDTGGESAVFIQVQRAWELVGTPAARAAYDRGHGFGDEPAPDYSAGSLWRPPAARTDTRPRARSYGHPGGWRRERYLGLIREWAGRGVTIDDPYDPALVRSAPQHLKRLLADALAEEATARIVADLGMGYTVWHDVAPVGARVSKPGGWGGAPSARAADSDAKIDHIVLGPSGLYGVLSEDFGGPVRLRRGELIGEGVSGAPIGGLVARMRAMARAAGVRFSGAIVVLPDDDVPDPIDEIGKVRGTPIAIVSRSALVTVLRRGISGVGAIGGNELFDVRTRLQHTVRFV